MLSYTDLKKGTMFIYESQPYEVIEMAFLRMQQRKAVVNTKIRNLISGKILDRTWQASDSFEETEVTRMLATFIYSKGARLPSPAAQAAGGQEYWFNEKGNPKNRFMLLPELLGEQAKFLKPQTEVTAFVWNEKVVKIQAPIKMDFKVIEAPPSIKGNTAQGGTKAVTIEGGATVQVPLFINQDDVIRINTETGEYVERLEKK
jgi:elongation factor P